MILKQPHDTIGNRSHFETFDSRTQNLLTAKVIRELDSTPYMVAHVDSWTESDKYGRKQQYIMVAKYGFDVDFAKRNIQKPYFSITAAIWRNGREDSFGMLHDMIRDRFPELEYLLKWHLTDIDGIPMHYIADGTFWYDVFVDNKKYDSFRGNPLNAFFSTIVYRSVSTDSSMFNFISNYHNGDTELVKQWLNDRIPEMINSFERDMSRANLFLRYDV